MIAFKGLAEFEVTPDAVKLLMKISASRLDEGIAPAQFVDMLLELVEITHQTALEERLGTDDLPPGGAPARPLRPSDKPKESVVPRWKVLGNDGPCVDCDGDECTMNCGPARAPVSVSAASKEAANSNTGGRPGRLTYDDRHRIKKRHAEAKEANGGQRVPMGFIDSLAAEFGCSKQRIHQILAE